MVPFPGTFATGPAGLAYCSPATAGRPDSGMPGGPWPEPRPTFRKGEVPMRNVIRFLAALTRLLNAAYPLAKVVRELLLTVLS
jgi:hypothetical protein